MPVAGTSAGGGYLAAIGDIKGSRRAEERADVQRRLESGLAAVNGEFGRVLASRFVVTLGDEFQGLLSQPSAVVDVLLRLEEELQGIPVRYGLGWGGLTTELRELALGMDGPCFHRARDALERGKRDDRWVTVSGFGNEEDAVLNGILWLMGEVRARWTDIQAGTVAQVRRARSQKEVAAARGVTASTVSEALRAAHYAPMLEAEAAVRTILGRFDRSAATEEAVA